MKSCRRGEIFYIFGAVLLIWGTVWLHRNWILHHFYTLGAYLKDSGWFADLIYRSDLRLTNPSALGGYFHPHSFYMVHVSPFLHIPGAISHHLPFDRVTWYAGFQAFIYGLCQAAVYCWGYRYWKRCFPEAGVFSWFSCLLFTSLYGANGIVLAAALFPHFEMLICALGLFFFYVLDHQYEAQASQLVWSGAVWILWLLCLSVREDAGLHLAALLLPITAWKIWCRQPVAQWRQIGLLAGGSLLLPLLLMVWQKKYFPGDDALRRVYLGDPFWSHLNTALLLERAQFFLQKRVYLWLPWALLVIAAGWKRSIFLGIGAVAFMPWFLLSFLAVSWAPAQFHSYYGFPFFFSQVWPWLEGALGMKSLRASTWSSCGWPVLIALAGAGGFWYSERASPGWFWEHARWPPPQRHLFAQRLAELETATVPWPEGDGQVDWSIASFYPNGFTEEQVFPSSHRSPDWVFFFHQGVMAAKNHAALLERGFDGYYPLKNLPVALAIRPSVSLPAAWAAWLENKVGLLLYSLTPVAPANRCGSILEVPLSQPDGYVFYGPFSQLESGPWSVHFHWVPVGGDGEVTFEVVEQSGQVLLARQSFQAATSSFGHPVSVQLDFTLARPAISWEFRAYQKGPLAWRLLEAGLVKLDH